MRIAIATDAWLPQINGVVRTLEQTIAILKRRGHEICVISPDQFNTVPCPGYSEIRLAVAPRFGLRRRLGEYQPDLVHISTEGPIGWSARGWCLSHDVPFTTAFHTRFPDYASLRTGLSPEVFWPAIRRFHAPSRAVLAATPRLIDELMQRGIPQSWLWTRGIDTELFRLNLKPHAVLARLPRPILLSVGRVAVEKNLEAFLSATVPGSKVIVGDGPDLGMLKARFPEATFTGALIGEALASAYAAADVFVFPSLTDTFGLVMIEALACGVPVAGHPVQGPLDVIGLRGLGPNDDLKAPIGALDESLSRAITRALGFSANAAAAYGGSYSWENATDQFTTALTRAVETGKSIAA